ncbi:cell wall protein%2C WapE [Streptococcus suis]|uniref:Cell wall protein, WapE n=1 Tax=Streptococcus suis TaxID=1307 RepID=A0A0Z8GHS1_STRSU|nr:LPXTG cell wall anchor domain-containing protein [Streptococcus suis]NQH36804.1 LPXTG cell wall anchor domain-containing protein [Streptococcus suis]CYU99043.1 cell wall protein%2C WapE [Streptococcus suis]
MKHRKLLLSTAALVATASSAIQVSAEEVTPLVESSSPEVVVETSEKSTVEQAQTLVEQTGQVAAETQAAQYETQSTLNNAQAELTSATQAQNENNAAIAQAEQTIAETETAIAQAQTELETANQTVAEATATVETEVAANPNAEQALAEAEKVEFTTNAANDVATTNVTAATKQVTEATKNVEQAQNDVNNAASNLTNAQNAVTTAESAVETKTTALNNAQTALDTKQAEVDAKTAELTQAVANAGAETITKTSLVKAENVKPRTYDNGERTYAETVTNPTTYQKMLLNKEVTIFDGQAVENVVLTPEQQAEYNEKGYYTYTPNAKAIAQYLLEYVNEIRRINGISEMLTYSSEVEALAQARAEEMLANEKLTHATEIKSNGLKDWENITAINGFTTSNSSLGGQSDKAVAYNLAFRYFAEYHNPSTGKAAYGHRNNFLFTNGEMGTGIAYKNTANNGFSLYTASIGNGPTNDWLFIDGFETDVTYETVTTNGITSTVQYYKGQRLKFLPQTTFVYYTTVTTTEPNAALTAAQKALTDYTSTAKTAIATLTNNVKTAQTELSTAQANLQTAKSNLATVVAKGDGKVALQTAKTELATAQANLQTAKSAQLKTASDLAVAKAKLEQVQKANQSLVDAKAKLVAAQNKASETQTKLNNLVATKQAATEKLTTATAQSQVIADRLEVAKTALAQAQSAYAAAVQSNTTAQNDYLEAKEVLARLLALAEDKTISILEDGTIIALPDTAPQAPVLPSLSLEQYLADKQSQIVTEGNQPVPVYNESGQVVDYKATPLPPVAQAPAGKTQATSKTATLPNTGSTTSQLAYIGLALGGLVLFVDRRRKNN